MKDKYISPRYEVSDFEEVDVLTSSGDYGDRDPADNDVVFGN